MSARDFSGVQGVGREQTGARFLACLSDLSDPGVVGCAVHELLDIVALTPGAAMSGSDANREVRALFYDGRGRFSDLVQI
jgi:hypothetical protein